MPRKKDIFRNKVAHRHEEFATEFYKPEGRPRPREVKSQKAQLEKGHVLPPNSGVKLGIHKKMN